MVENINVMTATPRAGLAWRDYVGLCKLKVVALIVFTAVVGMFMATPGMVRSMRWCSAPWGIGMAAASAAAINHLVDHRVDARMARTRNRPLPTGHLNPSNCLWFALSLGGLAMLVLVVFVNTLTAVLTFLSLIGYAVVYTMYLKRATPQNIVIGGGRRRRAARTGLGGGDGNGRPACIVAVSDHLCLDAAAFLGIGDPSPSGIRRGRHTHVAGDPRCRIHPSAGALVHRAIAGGERVALRDPYERLGLSDWGGRIGPRIPAPRRAPDAKQRGCDCRPSVTPLFTLWVSSPCS